MGSRNRTYRGVTYRSGYEKQVAMHLTNKGGKFQYEPFELGYYIPITGICDKCGSDQVLVYRRYIPDFVLSNGLIIESKGKFTSIDRTKMLRVIEWNPDQDIRMLFMRDNYLTRKKITRYSSWASKHGVAHAVSSKGEVPKDWMKGV